MNTKTNLPPSRTSVDLQKSDSLNKQKTDYNRDLDRKGRLSQFKITMQGWEHEEHDNQSYEDKQEHYNVDQFIDLKLQKVQPPKKRKKKSKIKTQRVQSSLSSSFEQYSLIKGSYHPEKV